MKRLGKIFSSKTSFSAFLQISCPNFGLKLCQKPWSYKIFRDLGGSRVNWGQRAGVGGVFGVGGSERYAIIL